ncbi:MAG: Mth938-like domain-containing protein [Elusimicrobiota bacterium]|nr:Mth938-like domain-containing protein [Elusimicrobiota bacterium]
MTQKTKIESYSFGKITINGKSYTDDIVVFPERVSPQWWRGEGHSLSMEDLSEVLDFHPDQLVVGTGNSGSMNVPRSTIDRLEEEGFKVTCRPTGEAIKIFNRKNSEGENVVGAFHLTC